MSKYKISDEFFDLLEGMWDRLGELPRREAGLHTLGLKERLAAANATVKKLCSAADKLLQCFPDTAPADFDIPAYIIEELRCAIEDVE